MKRCISPAILAAIAALFFSLAASAPAATVQTVTLVNQAGIRPSKLKRLEHALTIQSAQVHRYWHTPIVRFGLGGWPLVLLSPALAAEYALSSDGDGGVHYFANGIPTAVVSVTHNLSTEVARGTRSVPVWQVATSHELLEMLVDPSGTGNEICDPVQMASYTINRIGVSDFVLPSWFIAGSPGPWDYLRLTHRSGDAHYSTTG